MRAVVRMGCALVCACLSTAIYADNNIEDMTFSRDGLDGWIVGVGGGMDSIFLTNRYQLLITNSAGNPADLFKQSFYSDVSGIFDVSLGYLWGINHDGNVSLFFEYDYMPRADNNEKRYAFNIPANLSTYRYHIEQHAFLLMAKMDWVQWAHHFLPYFELGAGVSQNTFAGFSDASSSNVLVPFPNRTTTQACLVSGLGLDWKAANALLFGMGYRFGYWGRMQSGDVSNASPPGGALPAPIHLQHTLFSNQLMMKVSYVFLE